MRGSLSVLCCGALRPSEAGDRSTRAFFMDENLQHPNLFLLNLPIAELPVTEGFILRSKLMGFSSLGEIVSSNLREVSGWEDYSERWYLELVHLLERNGLIHLISR